MSGEIFTNPAVVGLAGGGVLVFLARLIWDKVMGGREEKSIPAQLAEINTKLADINTKLEMAAVHRSYMLKQVKEIETDFWDHMNSYHREFVPRRRPLLSDEESGGHVLQP